MTALDSIFSAFRIRWARLRGASVGSDCSLGPGVRFQRGIRDGQVGRITVGTRCSLDCGAILSAWGGQINLRANVFVGPYVVMYGHGGIEVGDHTLISMHCRILSSNHAIPPLGTDIRSQPDELRPTKICRDVWLGAGVTVLGGVTIGDGCIVGAGAVVTKDLPAGAIAYGIPATIRGWRDGVLQR
ncbi:MAG TPA: DapH/DapD/GlmU-related protein [Opitutaceae bacterium]|nr:DapH/DapD/GlmU-related protein [Opitutaceae bacterium]HRJ45754.1 DapH/DapD/GlmU-related protein [Opitutaceae bacterium]